MKKIYDIETTTCSSQTHSVVSESIGEAERMFLAEYPTATIKRVILHSEYVIAGTKDTCKWKTNDIGDIVFNPHNHDREFKSHANFCPICGLPIEVIA